MVNQTSKRYTIHIYYPCGNYAVTPTIVHCDLRVGAIGVGWAVKLGLVGIGVQ